MEIKDNVYYIDDYRPVEGLNLFDLDSMSFEDLCVLKGYLKAMAEMNGLEFIDEDE